mgnify:CR=1 FL=1
MENKIYLRFVEDEDFDDLLNWRNDESTRKSAFNTHLVSEEEHSKWFNDVINNPLKNQFIIMDQNQNKIGQIRFDRDSNNMYNCLENRNTSPGINLSPEYAEAAHNNLGIARQRLDQHEEAIQSFTEAVMLKPDYAKAHYNIARSFQILGQQDDAVLSYKKAIFFEADFDEAHYGLGSVLGSMKQYEKAAKSFKTAIQLNPNHVQAYFNLGWVYGKQGRHDKELKSYAKALEIDENYAKAHLGIGLAYLKKGQREEANGHYQKLKTMDGDMAEILHEMMEE